MHSFRKTLLFVSIGLTGCAAQRNNVLTSAVQSAAPAFGVAAQRGGPSAEPDFAAEPVAAAPQEAASALAGLYLFVGAGTSDFGGKRMDDSTFAGSSERTDSEFDLGVGYELTPVFALEASWNDPGKSTWSGTNNNGDTTGSFKVSGVQIAAVGRYEFARGFEAQARVGGYLWDGTEKSHTDDGKGGLVDDKADDDGFDPLLGLGVGAQIAPQVEMRLQWVRVFDLHGEDLDTYAVQFAYSL